MTHTQLKISQTPRLLSTCPSLGVPFHLVCVMMMVRISPPDVSVLLVSDWLHQHPYLYISTYLSIYESGTINKSPYVLYPVGKSGNYEDQELDKWSENIKFQNST
jgi:hypothetical protein